MEEGTATRGNPTAGSPDIRNIYDAFDRGGVPPVYIDELSFDAAVLEQEFGRFDRRLGAFVWAA